jgi:hypothetical protein
VGRRDAPRPSHRPPPPPRGLLPPFPHSPSRLGPEPRRPNSARPSRQRVGAARSPGRCGWRFSQPPSLHVGPACKPRSRPLFISLSPTMFLSPLPIALIAQNRCRRVHPLGPRPAVSLASLSSLVPPLPGFPRARSGGSRLGAAGARPWRTACGPGVLRSPPPRSPGAARHGPLGVLPRRGTPARGRPRCGRPSRGAWPWRARPRPGSPAPPPRGAACSPRRGARPPRPPPSPAGAAVAWPTALARPGARHGVLYPGSAPTRAACSRSQRGVAPSVARSLLASAARPRCGALVAPAAWRGPACYSRRTSAARRGLLVARGAAPARHVPAPAWLAASAPGAAWLAASAPVRLWRTANVATRSLARATHNVTRVHFHLCANCRAAILLIIQKC